MREPRNCWRSDCDRVSEIGTVEHYFAAAEAAAVARKSHGGKPDRRLASAQFTDKSQHFATVQREVDALDYRQPDPVAVAVDMKVTDI